MATALTPIAWQSLASASASVTFSSIPGTYRDLRLIFNGTATSATGDTVVGSINGDAGANYSAVAMAGDGTSASSSSTTGQTTLYLNWFTALSSASRNVTVVDYLDYAVTDKHKVVLSRSNNTANGTEALALRWASTAAITSVTIKFASANTWAAGSTFALYGVSA